MLTHSEDKQHMCSECGYVTKWKHYLNVHMRKHTGDLRCVSVLFVCPSVFSPQHDAFRNIQTLSIKPRLTNHYMLCVVYPLSVGIISNNAP